MTRTTSVLTLVSIAQTTFLSEHAHTHTHTHKVTDASYHPTHDSATSRTGN